MALKIKTITGQIRLVSGLHIGAGTTEIEIGGIDNPVIKDPRTGYPYIPGSSLKGKIRSLLEIKDKKDDNGKPCKCGKKDCKICTIFGNTNPRSETGFTRAIFRDAFLSEESIRELDEHRLLPTEAKMENTINRTKGTAENPRTSERAIAGLIFDFEISIRVLDGDADVSLNTIVEGLKMLEKDALGGSGSRGYGRIKFENVKCDDKEIII